MRTLRFDLNELSYTQSPDVEDAFCQWELTGIEALYSMPLGEMWGDR